MIIPSSCLALPSVFCMSVKKMFCPMLLYWHWFYLSSNPEPVISAQMMVWKAIRKKADKRGRGSQNNHPRRGWRNVKSTKCQVDEMLSRRIGATRTEDSGMEINGTEKKRKKRNRRFTLQAAAGVFGRLGSDSSFLRSSFLRKKIKTIDGSSRIFFKKTFSR